MSNDARKDFERLVKKPPMWCKWSEEEGQYVAYAMGGLVSVVAYNRDYRIFCEGRASADFRQAKADAVESAYKSVKEMYLVERKKCDHSDGVCSWCVGFSAALHDLQEELEEFRKTLTEGESLK